MTKLKLGPIIEDKSVKGVVELPGSLHRDLVAYAEVLARETGQPTHDSLKLIVPMLERFIATDRGFAKAKRAPLTMVPAARSREAHAGEWCVC